MNTLDNGLATIDLSHRRVIKMAQTLDRYAASGQSDEAARAYLMAAIRADLFTEQPLVITRLSARLKHRSDLMRVLARLREVALHIYPLPGREIHLLALPILIDITKVDNLGYLIPSLQSGAEARVAAGLQRATGAINVQVCTQLASAKDIQEAEPTKLREFAASLEAGNAQSTLGTRPPWINGYTSHADMVYLLAAITLPMGWDRLFLATYREAIHDITAPIIRNGTMAFSVVSLHPGTRPGIAIDSHPADYARISAQNGNATLQRKQLSRILQNVAIGEEPVELWYAIGPGGRIAIAATAQHANAVCFWQVPDWGTEPNIDRELLIAQAQADVPVTAAQQLDADQFQRRFGCHA
jgi:hypothetical protein